MGKKIFNMDSIRIHQREKTQKIFVSTYFKNYLEQKGQMPCSIPLIIVACNRDNGFSFPPIIVLLGKILFTRC
jgi:hypothetical protein